MDALLTPPIAFLLYLLLAGALYLAGRVLGGVSPDAARAHEVYASGETPPEAATPDYSGVFLAATFFLVLHVSVLVLASGAASLTGIVYLLGVLLTLAALMRD